ncbi:uncharacterized protein LOC108912736 [Anoplophora glabripennis]|uniref:uncharacterized protein LOC108912736 n=1 Tax=Anoplophora glabripennis TaxID=217634 RepID=UPI000874D92C|nr:uncharacterized protein LOC108912736 [Anoplophora glabripennis]XP_018573603.1 uncharacterized protein LOC108912736 [Anoplophora glabripennis]XP_018573614.1 uncharacterized protein LOC108912736 [Anoplophora glabripennis]XP_018573625.1 uncharacterized protein LOC108912736 [Anoplophora glabripennis]
MEILKKFRSWLSFKKGVSPETNTYQENKERNTNRKKRSVKRNAEPVSEEESVRRKCYKKETTTKSLNKAQLENKNFESHTISTSETLESNLEAKDPARIIIPSKQNHVEEEGEDNEILNDYEIKTIGSIQEIRGKCEKFDQEIESFPDIMGSKQFLMVDENLQSHIETLDRIDAKDSTIIRKERKSAVRYICLLIDRLEIIAKKNHEQLVKPNQMALAPISREQFLEGKKEE